MVAIIFFPSGRPHLANIPLSPPPHPPLPPIPNVRTSFMDGSLTSFWKTRHVSSARNERLHVTAIGLSLIQINNKIS